MDIVIVASVLGGTTTTAAIYQAVLTGNPAWLWLLALNLLWFAGIVLGVSEG